MVYFTLYLFVALAIYMAAFVSYFVVKTDMLSCGQKIAILAISWLIPLIGPVFVRIMLNDQFDWRSRETTYLDDNNGGFLQESISNSRVLRPSGRDHEYQPESSEHGDSD